jgi:hypothetical protein
MNERHLEPEKPLMRLLVDELDALRGEIPKLVVEIAHRIGHVVHPGTTLGQKPADRRVLAERADKLDAAFADPHRSGLDALVRDGVAALDFCSEEPSVGVDSVVEILDGDPEVVDPLRLHARRMLSAASVRPFGRFELGTLERNDTTDRFACL